MNDLRCGAASLLRGERHPDAKSGWLKGGTGIPLPVARHFSPVPFRVIKNDSGLTLNLSYCLCPKTLSSLEVIPFFLVREAPPERLRSLTRPSAFVPDRWPTESPLVREPPR